MIVPLTELKMDDKFRVNELRVCFLIETNKKKKVVETSRRFSAGHHFDHKYGMTVVKVNPKSILVELDTFQWKDGHHSEPTVDRVKIEFKFNPGLLVNKYK